MVREIELSATTGFKTMKEDEELQKNRGRMWVRIQRPRSKRGNTAKSARHHNDRTRFNISMDGEQAPITSVSMK